MTKFPEIQSLKLKQGGKKEIFGQSGVKSLLQYRANQRNSSFYLAKNFRMDAVMAMDIYLQQQNK